MLGVCTTSGAPIANFGLAIDENWLFSLVPESQCPHLHLICGVALLLSVRSSVSPQVRVLST